MTRKEQMTNLLDTFRKDELINIIRTYPHLDLEHAPEKLEDMAHDKVVTLLTDLMQLND